MLADFSSENSFSFFLPKIFGQEGDQKHKINFTWPNVKLIQSIYILRDMNVRCDIF